MDISVRAHDIGKYSIDVLTKKIADYGFNGAQLAIHKAIDGQGLNIDLEKSLMNKIGQEFDKNNIKVTMFASYFNPVHSNKQLVKSSIERFMQHLSLCKYANCNLVGTETGSYNDDVWTFNINNRTEEAYQEIKTAFTQLSQCAKENGTFLCIEGAFGHVCFEPKRLKRLFDDINNGHVKIIVDLFNYLDISNYHRQREIFDQCIELFNDDIVVFHIKDFVVTNNSLKQVGIGQGLLDYKYVLPIMKKCPNAKLVFEGVKPNDFVSSVTFLNNI